MKSIKIITIASTLFASAGILSAEYMQILSPANSTGYSALRSDGTTLASAGDSGTFKFGLGYFLPGFTATQDNWDQWAANFVTFTTIDWTIGGPSARNNRINSTFSMNDPSFTGQQGVIWGYDSLDATGDWIAFTSESWTFPVFNALSTAPVEANIWNISDPDVTIVGNMGTILDNGFQMQAIPEPSTYALIFGLGILGFLGFRRFRK